MAGRPGSEERPPMDVTELDGRGYTRFITAGAYFLRKYRQELNDLNVFPVPDGDTGTNMFLTARQAALQAGRTNSASLASAAAAAAEGALMGARGNSGVIISQMLRGFAHHVRHREKIDTFMLATGMREAAAAARAALVKPVAGTILSVAEAAAESAYHLSLHEKDFYRLATGVLRAANDALDRTPDQLPALKEAGVVDAGGAGFVYFMEGALRFLPDTKVRTTAFPRRPARERGAFTVNQRVGENKFCTEFLLEHARCSPIELRDVLQSKGDSLIVAGAQPTIKVHIHTDDPDGVKAAAAKFGEPTRVKVDNMEQQHNVLVVDKPAAPYSIVAIVPGPGFERIAKELGAEVTLVTAANPSVRDILLAINKALSDPVYLFVNDKNAVLAAREAARLSGRSVHVLPTEDIVGGIAGLFAARSLTAAAVPAELEEIAQAAQRARSAQLYLAGKDASVGGTSVARGKPAATAAGTLFSGNTFSEAAQQALGAMGADGGGLITVYYGGGQKERDAQRLADDLRIAFPGTDVEYYYGGQKGVEYWISLDE